jgi:small subunit ribosomal protein S17
MSSLGGLEKQASVKLVRGIVVSDKMMKTIVVEVERVTRHPMYDKVLRTKKSYKVHDENGTAKVGDVVVVKECAPLSKTKHMVLVEIVNP